MSAAPEKGEREQPGGKGCERARLGTAAGNASSERVINTAPGEKLPGTVVTVDTALPKGGGAPM